LVVSFIGIRYLICNKCGWSDNHIFRL